MANCKTLQALVIVVALTAYGTVSAQDIFEAIENADLGRIENLLDADAALLEGEDDDLNRPLHHAAWHGDLEVIDLLVGRGAVVDARSRSGKTPLILAAMNRQVPAARRLLEAGADVTLAEDYGRTPLAMVARETGHFEMAELLVAHASDVNHVDRGGESILDLAAWRGFREIVNLLLDNGVEFPTEITRHENLVMFAAEKALDRLFGQLSPDADLAQHNSLGGSLLHSACGGGSLAIVERLLEHGLDLRERDRYGWTPLHYAAKKGRTPVVELLAARGADLDALSLAGGTPLQQARFFEREETTAVLIELGADRDAASFPRLDGPWLGQTPPDDTVALFAPDIISSNRFEHGTVTFSPDGREAFWSSSFMLSETGYSYGRLLTSRLVAGSWTEPRMWEHSGIRLGDGEPFFSPDGRRLYFRSRRPRDDEEERAPTTIWFSERTDAGWAAPTPIEGGPNAIGHYWQFSIAANGDIYLGSSAPGGFGDSDLYVSRRDGDTYLEPENLDAVLNSEYEESSPFIAPDGSWLLYTRWSHPDDQGACDLVISFRDDAGDWTAPVGLPESINTAGRELCPHLSGDGRYLFFNSFRNGDADNYWVSAEVIGEVRRQVLK